jgi:EcsC protein family
VQRGTYSMLSPEVTKEHVCVGFAILVSMSNLSLQDYADLRTAAAKLETQSFAMTVASKLGVPAEALLHLLPKGAKRAVGTAVDKALRQCLQIAIKVGKPRSGSVNNKRVHTAAVAVTGAVGGFFGLPGLVLELPITTTLMLHSIVEIARSQGEDFVGPDSALACLEVFALGPEGARGELVESAYYATRTALSQATREAASYVARKGLAKEGAPALISFVGKIGSRFGLEVSEKAAAELIPIAGAFGGLTLNVLFSHHFQNLAEGHFTVRRLERKYGAGPIRLAYERARPSRLS